MTTPKFIADLPSLGLNLDDEFEIQQTGFGLSGKGTLAELLALVPPSSTVWGSIIGNLPDQTDLQAALDAKADSSELADYLPLTGGTLSNTLIIDGPIFNSHLRLLRAGTESWDLSPSTSGSLVLTNNLVNGTNAFEIRTNLQVTGQLSVVGNITSSAQVRSTATAPLAAQDLTRKDYVDTGLAAKIGDAPADGQQYARKDNAWEVVAAAGATAWGTIVGTLSDQTDLQAALDAKADDTDLAGYLPLTGGTVDALTVTNDLNVGGNVGVGITPLAKLHVESSNADVAWFSSTTTQSNILFEDANTIALPQIGSVGDSLVMRTSSMERMRVDSAGNVLVGTTAASAKLAVSGDTNGYVGEFLNDVRSSIRIRSTTNDQLQDLFFFGPGTTPVQSIYFGDTASTAAGAIQYAHGADAMDFFAGGFLKAMRIDANARLVVENRVSIGNGHSPSTLLHLQLPSGENGEMIRMGRSGGAFHWRLGVSSDSAFTVSDNGGNEAMRVDSAGNLIVEGDIICKGDVKAFQP